jgi:hypothetical protein
MEAGHRTATAEIYERTAKKLARIGSLMEDDFVLRKPPTSTNRNSLQQAARNRFNINHLRTTDFNRFQ